MNYSEAVEHCNAFFEKLASLISKIKRKWTEWRINVLKRIIKWAVAKLDDLELGTFLAFSWSRDEHNEYHVLAKRFYDWGYVYGTSTTWYDDILRR